MFFFHPQAVIRRSPLHTHTHGTKQPYTLLRHSRLKIGEGDNIITLKCP